MHIHAFHSVKMALAVALAACAITGCGRGGSPSLNEDVARSSLTVFLEAWKKGERPTALASQSPEIIVGDAQWNQGARLVAYRVLDSVANDGSNLHQPVELELEDGAGKRTRQQVKYIVGTSP